MLFLGKLENIKYEFVYQIMFVSLRVDSPNKFTLTVLGDVQPIFTLLVPDNFEPALNAKGNEKSLLT
jgi:hypothetical protein